MKQEGRLKVVAGFLANKDIVLPKAGEFQIGRTRRCDLPIMSRRISRQHAKISFSNGVFTIEDLDSKTGTRVNNHRITSTILRSNDVIQIGDIKLQFVLAEADAKAPAHPERPVVIPPKPTPRAPKSEEPKSDLSEYAVPEFDEDELDAIGTTIGGVKLITPIARGRRTLIYKGVHSGRNRVVAFKMLNPEAVKNPEIANWLIMGVQRAAELRHEDTVVALGGGHEKNALFVYTPFMEKGSAQERFADAQAEGLSTIKRALESIVHLARALEFAQSKNILHLGLRPSKVLYNETYRAKLAGLGYDNTCQAPGAESTRNISAYLAPEQVTRAMNCTQATDIFSLGATFYYMLTGRRPRRDVRHRISSPQEKNSLVPDSICRITEKMLDPDPARRYQSYGQLIHDVRWALRGEAWPHT